MTVKQIQCLLTYLGYSPGTIDGADGRNTQGAIRVFQADYGLTVDGLVGKLTWNKIYEVYTGIINGLLVPTERPGPQKTGAFWDGIKYFKREEFRCPCGKCGGFPVEPKEALVKQLVSIREHFNAPITIVPLPPANAHSGGSGVSGIQRFVAGQREEFTACTGKGRRHHCQRFFWNLGQGLL